MYDIYLLSPRQGFMIAFNTFLHVLMQDQFHMLKLVISVENRDDPAGWMTNTHDGVCGYEHTGFSRLAILIAVLQLYRITSWVLREEVGTGSTVLGEGPDLVFSQATFPMSLSVSAPCCAIWVSWDRSPHSTCVMNTQSQGLHTWVCLHEHTWSCTG